jgi:adenosylcobinamide-phosphate synthase
LKILASYLLDLILGDPEISFHPVRIMGLIISREERIVEKICRSPIELRIAGLVMVFFTVIVVYLSTLFIIGIAGKFGEIPKNLCEILLIYTTVSVKGLVDAGRSVLIPLEKSDIEEARRRLSFIVSRDTENLPEREIIRGVLESLSENICDGIVAPLFYAFIGGAPLAMVYKAINTLDSMVGYKREIYIHLGYFPAKTDDIVNFIPARIAGIMIVLSSWFLGYNWRNSLRIFLRDRLNHESPNSAHGMAALSGALGVRLGGPTIYHSEIVYRPYIGDPYVELAPRHINDAICIVYASSFLALVFLYFVKFLVEAIF